jgi:hypothetical protein
VNFAALFLEWQDGMLGQTAENGQKLTFTD